MPIAELVFATIMMVIFVAIMVTVLAGMWRSFFPKEDRTHRLNRLSYSERRLEKKLAREETQAEAERQEKLAIQKEFEWFDQKMKEREIHGSD